MTAAFVAAAVRSMGLLLTSGMMILSAAAARPLSASPAGMIFRAAGIGTAGVVLGLFASLEWDLPAAPAIIAAEALLFVAAWGWAGMFGKEK